MLTDRYQVLLAKSLISHLTSNTCSTYIVAARPYEWANEDYPDAEVGSDQSSNRIRNSMIAGVRVTSQSVSHTLPRRQWVAGATYDQYDYTKDMRNKLFYVVNSNRDVFKCIFNNRGAASTVEPISKIIPIFETSDGYRWKYMYTIDEVKDSLFGDENNMAVTANTSVTGSAVKGTIDAYDVLTSDTSYFATNSGTIQQVLGNTVFRIDNNAVPNANAFVDSAIYIPTGAGAGSLSRIVSSHANSLGKFISTETPLSLDTTSSYMITPHVVIEGDGVGAKAVSYVEEGQITKVVPIDAGTGYSEAQVHIKINPGYDSTATVVPLISPLDGHGSHPEIELQSEQIVIAGEFLPDVETDSFSSISYSQVALVCSLTDSAGVPSSTDTLSFATHLTINSGTYAKGDVIIGDTSQARGVVYQQIGNKISLIDVTGEFEYGETIRCVAKSLSSVVTLAVDSEADKNSGVVIYFTNVLPINRTVATTESVRMVINFEG